MSINFSENGAPEKEARTDTEMVPYRINFSSFSKWAGGDTFGVLFHSNDTQLRPNLERKNVNTDFIREKGDKLSLENIFVDKESVTDFPKDPLEKKDTELVLILLMDMPKVLQTLLMDLKTFEKFPNYFWRW